MNDFTSQVSSQYRAIHQKLIDTYSKLDPSAQLESTEHTSPTGGISVPHIFTEGDQLEKVAALFTSAQGDSLPSAASQRNPQLANKPFTAVSVSTIIHPKNPHIPTAHMNLRFFNVQSDSPSWYFGGGFDLTPHIPYREDCVTWHEYAHDACEDVNVYDRLKQQCDDYFFLPHRQEHRGIGGLFFDDWTEGGFAAGLNLVSRIGQAFIDAFSLIFARRCEVYWTSDEEEWMLIRRGRYAEFNLLYDRGTKYGIESGRRIESVLASLPPRVKWHYEYQPDSLRCEIVAAHLQEVLKPRDWLDPEAIKS